MKIYVVAEYSSQDSPEQTVLKRTFLSLAEIIIDYKDRGIDCSIDTILGSSDNHLLVSKETDETIAEIVETKLDFYPRQAIYDIIEDNQNELIPVSHYRLDTEKAVEQIMKEVFGD